MIPKRPIFVGEGESTNMLDVLPKELTLLPINEKYYPKSCFRPVTETIFKEVTYKPYQQRPEVTELLSKRIHFPVSMRKLYTIFKDGIEKVWDPTKRHIIGHSSGVDSRLLSKAIKELGEKNGREWLGEVFYVENMGEGDLFYQIKDVMGFEGESYNNDVSSDEFNRDYLTFRTHWEKFNTVVAYPLNQWLDGYTHMGIDPSNVQGFTGYGANETQAKAVRLRRGYKWYFPWVFHLQLTQWKHFGGDMEHPFLDWDFLHALQSCPEAQIYKRININMAAKMVPELKHIPHIHTKEVVAMGYRNVSDQLLKDCYAEYKKSWFGKHFSVTPTPEIEYTEWWFHYNAASWCEHLLDYGYKIKLS